jgi:hypothetical protein
VPVFHVKDVDADAVAVIPLDERHAVYPSPHWLPDRAATG